MTERIFYPALIEDVRNSYAIASVQVGRVEMRIDFPIGAILPHNLQKGDRFRWYSAKDNSVSARDIEVVERAKDPVNLPQDWLLSVTNPEQEKEN